MRQNHRSAQSKLSDITLMSQRSSEHKGNHVKSVVVFESMYGNTHAIAEQIAAGLESIGSVVLGNPTQVAATTAADPERFLVSDTAGPLLPGEAERARQWDEELARRLHTRSGPNRTR